MTDPRALVRAGEMDGLGLDDWRMLFAQLHARFETGDFATGVAFVQQVGKAADAMDHHPDIELTYPRVDVRLSSHDVGGVTSRDVELARRISEIAARLGAAARPGAVSTLELALDTPDAAEIEPFWAAVLGYSVPERTGGGHEVIDPDGRGPTIWFQRCEPHETPPQRWHLDLRVPPEVVAGRIEAALAAGGTLVSDDEAPAFWMLADAQGNRCCLTTWQGRG